MDAPSSGRANDAHKPFATPHVGEFVVPREPDLLGVWPVAHTPHEEDPASALPAAHCLKVEFTGTGSGYFRLWLIDLLLSIFTLSLYWPFARARQLAYFHRHTRVGEHALDFQANPWTMLQNHLLLMVLSLLCVMVCLFMPQLVWLPALLLALLWPALWHASLLFRLRHTSWQGIRMDFAGSMQEAYAVVLPLWLPIMILAALASMVSQPAWRSLSESEKLMGPLGFGMAGVVAALPWLMARLHAYKHSGYALGKERALLTVAALAKPLYLLYLQLLGIGLALTFCGVALAALQAASGSSTGVALSLGALYLSLPLILAPFFKAGAQNLLWSQTRSQRLAFHSSLSFPQLLTVHLQNWTLIVLTLGLYWPFAVVRLTRLRLQAMTVQVQGDAGAWSAQSPLAASCSAGDAAAPLLGVDVAL